MNEFRDNYGEKEREKLENYAKKRGYNTGKHKKCVQCGMDLKPHVFYETIGEHRYCLKCANREWSDPFLQELRTSCELALRHLEQSVALLRTVIEKSKA